MITEFGMGQELTNQVFGSSEGSVFLGRSFAEGRNYSEQTQDKIDEEVAKIISEATKRAEETIIRHRAKLDQIAEKLIQEETIEGKEFEALFESVDKEKKSPAKAKKPVK